MPGDHKHRYNIFNFSNGTLYLTTFISQTKQCNTNSIIQSILIVHLLYVHAADSNLVHIVYML